MRAWGGSLVVVAIVVVLAGRRSEGQTPVTAGGYRGILWKTSEAEARRRLPAKKRFVCALPSDMRSPADRQFGYPLHAIASALGESEPVSLIKRFEYSDQRRGLQDVLTVAPVGPGCGIFFRHEYVGQLNSTEEVVDEKGIVAEMEKTLGSAKMIGHEGFYSRFAGGQHNVYRFTTADTVAFLVYWGDRVATLYLSSKAASELVPAMDAEVRARQSRDAATSDRERKSNVRKAASSL